MGHISKKNLVGILAIFFSLGGLAGWYFLMRSDTNIVELKASEVRPSFSIYYPVLLIDNDELSVKQVEYSNGIFIYKLATKAGQTATLSQQKLPSDLKNSEPQGQEEVKTPFGKAAISLLEDRTTAVLIGEQKTLLSVNANSTFPIDSLKNILRSLEKVN